MVEACRACESRAPVTIAIPSFELEVWYDSSQYTERHDETEKKLAFTAYLRDSRARLLLPPSSPSLPSSLRKQSTSAATCEHGQELGASGDYGSRCARRAPAASARETYEIDPRRITMTSCHRLEELLDASTTRLFSRFPPWHPRLDLSRDARSLHSVALPSTRSNSVTLHCETRFWRGARNCERLAVCRTPSLCYIYLTANAFRVELRLRATSFTQIHSP